MNNEATIKVANVAQKVLLDTELLGQFSDGYWENSRNESWKYLNNVEVANDTGVEFISHVPYDYKGYSVNNKTLLDIVGDRMLAKARVAQALNISELGDVESLFENNIIGNKIINGTEITVEDFQDQINDWMKRENFWKQRATDCIDFLGRYGTQNVVNAINDTSYGMKEMRKDLTAITKTLKNVK